MAIDPQQVLGAPAVEGERAWTEADVALYHLGLGAGDPPTDERELEYVLEDRLKVLPSFGVLHSYPLVLRAITETPGLAIDLSSALHGSQEIEVRRPLPAAGAVRTRGRWVAVHDKGSSAVLEHETALVDAAGDELLVARASTFARGAGGFGGEPGSAPRYDVPGREPDVRVTRATRPDQALLYRLSGDLNPLHADPAFARRAGFERPLLHGLCTYGVVVKAVVDELLDGDVARVRRYGARFSGVVFPGETLDVSIWRDGDAVAVAARVPERSADVLAGAIGTRAGAENRGDANA